jgi:hypothetical protein
MPATTSAAGPAADPRNGPHDNREQVEAAASPCVVSSLRICMRDTIPAGVPTKVPTQSRPSPDPPDTTRSSSRRVTCGGPTADSPGDEQDGIGRAGAASGPAEPKPGPRPHHRRTRRSAPQPASRHVTPRGHVTGEPEPDSVRTPPRGGRATTGTSRAARRPRPRTTCTLPELSRAPSQTPGSPSPDVT